MPQITPQQHINIQPANGGAAATPAQNTANIDAIAQRLDGVGPLQSMDRSWSSFEAPVNDAGSGTLRASRRWLRASAPVLLGGSVDMIATRNSGGMLDFAPLERGIGWVSLPFAVAIDAVKAPIGLAGAGMLGAVGGLQRLFGAALGRRDELALNAILDSVLDRMPKSLAVLCAAGVETPDSLRRALNTNGQGRLLALTLIHTAFVSRDLADGTLRMASGRTLPANVCPRVGRPLLDTVTEAQRFFRAHAPASNAGAAVERRFIAQWLPALSAALQGNVPTDAPQPFRELVALCERLAERAVALPVVQRRAAEIGMVSNRVHLPVERQFIPAPVQRHAPAQAQRRAPTQATTHGVSEDDVLRAFHRMLVQAVTSNRHVQRDDYEMLEPRAMLAAPSLALFEAAVASRDGSVTSVLEDGRSVTLTTRNCPPRLRTLFERWQRMATQLRGLNEPERDYLRWFLSMGDEGSDAQRAWPLTPERQAQLRHDAGDLCGLALVITRRATYQSRLSSDFQQVLDTLPANIEAEVASATAAATTSTLTPAQQAGVATFTRALAAAAQRNSHRAAGDEDTLAALSLADLMRSGEWAQGNVGQDDLPADLFELHQALAPVQALIAGINPNQFRALERLLGAPSGDLRFVDARVENLAVVLTDVARNIEALPSVQQVFASVERTAG